MVGSYVLGFCALSVLARQIAAIGPIGNATRYPVSTKKDLDSLTFSNVRAICASNGIAARFSTGVQSTFTHRVILSCFVLFFLTLTELLRFGTLYDDRLPVPRTW